MTSLGVFFIFDYKTTKGGHIMSKRKTKDELYSHQQAAVNKIKNYLADLIDSDDSKLLVKRLDRVPEI